MTSLADGGPSAALLITPDPAAAATWQASLPIDLEVAHAPDITSGAMLFDRLYGHLGLVIIDRAFGDRESNGLLAWVARSGYDQHLIEVGPSGNSCSHAGSVCRTGLNIGPHIEDCFAPS